MKNKIDFKDWKFWFKFLVGATIVLTLLITLVVDLVEINSVKNQIAEYLVQHKNLTIENVYQTINEHFKNNSGVIKKLPWITIAPVFDQSDKIADGSTFNVSANFGDFIINYFTFFTTLSNLVVGAWFLTAAFLPSHEGKKGFLNYYSTSVVVTYITITMLIYNLMLMPYNAIAGTMTLNRWIIGSVLHVVFPLTIILYFVYVFQPENKIELKTYRIKGWLFQISVLLTYGIYVLIRGELRYQGNKSWASQYPYFFFHIHDSKVMGMPGAVWFIIAICVIAGIAIGFSTLYIWSINKRFDKQKLNLNK